MYQQDDRDIRAERAAQKLSRYAMLLALPPAGDYYDAMASDRQSGGG